MLKNLRRNTASVLALVTAVVLAVFIFLLATSDTKRNESVNFEILGDVAPEIAGPTIAGDEYSLRAQRGNWVVVNFFASWCVGCRVEHPELVELRDRHRNGGVELVGVMFGDTEANARAFFDELGGDWPALVSDTGRIAIDYGVTAVPETLLVSPAGRVVQKWIGANGVTADEIDSAITQFENRAVTGDDGAGD
jgi:cytochrome c biogenesis protein CcmG/thiol:disulfide interchange protein DsbE